MQITVWVCMYWTFTLWELMYIDRYEDSTLMLSNFATYFSGFVVTSLLHFYFKKKEILLNKKSFVKTFIVVFVSNLIWNIFDYFLTYLFHGWLGFEIIPALILFGRSFMMILGWTVFYHSFRILYELKSERDKNRELALYAESAQLNALRYQINPHFLFNSLNSLRALIYKSPVDAEEMISKLSDFMRYTLANKNSDEIPLENEIDVIQDYLKIEKIRYGNNYELEIAVEPIANEFPIPPFLILPLVDNAVKYGMKTSSMPLKISLGAEVNGNELSLIVQNSGHWFDEKGIGKPGVYGTGTGLENIKNRLKNMYHQNQKFIIKKAEKCVSVIIKIKKEVNEHETQNS